MSEELENEKHFVDVVEKIASQTGANTTQEESHLPYVSFLFGVIAESSLTKGLGFIDYNDTSTSSTPLTIVADTWTDVPNNGLGAFTNKAFAPDGITELMDTSTGYLDFTQLSLGDSIEVRIDFKTTPSINNSLLEVRYELGGGADVYPLDIYSDRLDVNAGIPYDSFKNSFIIYMGDENTLNNPGKLQVKLSGGGTLVNAGVAIIINKRS